MNQMPYSVKLISDPIESGRKVNSFPLRFSLSKRRMRIKRATDKANVALHQVGQRPDRIRQRGQLVAFETDSMKESDENSLIEKSNAVLG